MKPNCIATRGNHHLIDDGDGRGHVEDDQGNPQGDPARPLPIQSILARGYWEGTGRRPSELPKIVERTVTVDGRQVTVQRLAGR